MGIIRIGPPYIYINIDPVIVHLGPLALRWYGLMYVVGIILGLWAIRGYTARKGIDENLIYRVLWWCIAAGLIGGRLYFVIQQPNFVSYYLSNPIHIIATWEGGMAFYGAIFLVVATLIWRARVEHVNPLVLLDAGVLFAAVGQIFGRIGNIINGDIIGYPSKLPWSTVYQNPNSWACLNPATCNVPVQPAAAYELLTNVVLVALLFFLARRVRRPGILLLVYLFAYAITQFLLFFVRANDIVSFLGLHWGLKQAQWTSLVVFIALIPISVWILRNSKSVPPGEIAATYGIPQPEEEPPATEYDEEEEEEEGAPVPAGNIEEDEEESEQDNADPSTGGQQQSIHDSEEEDDIDEGDEHPTDEIPTVTPDNLPNADQHS